MIRLCGGSARQERQDATYRCVGTVRLQVCAYLIEGSCAANGRGSLGQRHCGPCRIG